MQTNGQIIVPASNIVECRLLRDSTTTIMVWSLFSNIWFKSHFGMLTSSNFGFIIPIQQEVWTFNITVQKSCIERLCRYTIFRVVSIHILRRRIHVRLVRLKFSYVLISHEFNVSKCASTLFMKKLVQFCVEGLWRGSSQRVMLMYILRCWIHVRPLWECLFKWIECLKICIYITGGYDYLFNRLQVWCFTPWFWKFWHFVRWESWNQDFWVLRSLWFRGLICLQSLY